MQGRWERCMSGVRWQGGKDGRVSEMARREIPCVIQQWGTQGETKILPFCF